MLNHTTNNNHNKMGTYKPGAKPRRVLYRRGRSARVEPHRRNRTVSVPRNKLAFPTSIRTKLRYTEKQDYTLASTSLTSHIAWRGNNMRDPYVPVGGHQPRGYDQFMLTYGKYTVHGAKVAVNVSYMYGNGPSVVGTAPQDLIQLIGTGAEVQVAAVPAVMVGLYKGPAALTAGSVQEQMEKDGTKWLQLSNAKSSGVLSTSMKVADFYGTKGDLTGREGFVGDNDVLAQGDPENEVIFDLWAQHLGESNSGVIKIICFVTITYDVTFSEPVALPPS